jgi:peptidoglycan/xylan/chitin deacetylase (PgdA/CDA1 family)
LGDVLILCYHAVSRRWPATLSVTPQQLRGHVSLIARRGYRGVTFSEAVAGPRAPKAAAITFDDAYRSVYEHALPILSEAGLTATVFAPTAFIGQEEPMSWPGIDNWLTSEHRDELIPMSWQELERVAEVGWEVGSHTRSHPHLPGLGEAELDAELRQPREEIEDRLGRCCSLAYPYGDYDDRVIAAARRAGYCAAGTLPGRLELSGGPLERPRIGIYHVDNGRRFRAKVSPLLRRARGAGAWKLLDVGRRHGFDRS